MSHAARVAADLPLPSVIPAASGASVARVTDDAGAACLARLITVVPGSPAEGRPVTTELAGQIGALAARTSLALQGLFHRAGGRVLDWDVRRAHHVLGEPDVLGRSRRSRPAGRRAPAAPGRRGRRHGGLARWPQPRRRHPDQHLDQHHPGRTRHHRADRLRRHAPHSARLRSGRHPDLRRAQYRRAAAGGHLGPGRRRPDRLPAAPPADPAGGRRPRRPHHRPPRPDAGDLAAPAGRARGQPGLHRPVRHQHPPHPRRAPRPRPRPGHPPPAHPGRHQPGDPPGTRLPRTAARAAQSRADGAEPETCSGAAAGSPAVRSARCSTPGPCTSSAAKGRGCLPPTAPATSTPTTTSPSSGTPTPP